MSARVVEAETKLKTEILRIKKKLQIHITELEMSLDVANRTNIDLQKTIKKQSLQLTELQGLYEDVNRNLQQTLDQYGVAQRRIQSISGELEEFRVNLDSTQRSKRQVELALEETSTRVNELSSINVSINSSRVKLEQEIQVLASDYEEVTRELRLSDERYQKVQVILMNKKIVQVTFDAIKNLVIFLDYRWSLNTPLRSSTRNKKESSRLKPSRSHWKLKLKYVWELKVFVVDLMEFFF